MPMQDPLLNHNISSQVNLHCHNVQCSPYSTISNLFPLSYKWLELPSESTHAPEMQSPLWDTPSLPPYTPPLSFSGSMQTCNHLFLPICGPSAHFLNVVCKSPLCTLLPGNSGPHFISVFLTTVIVVDKDNDPLQCLLHLLHGALKLFLTGMHSAS